MDELHGARTGAYLEKGFCWLVAVAAVGILVAFFFLVLG